MCASECLREERTASLTMPKQQKTSSHVFVDRVGKQRKKHDHSEIVKLMSSCGPYVIIHLTTRGTIPEAVSIKIPNKLAQVNWVELTLWTSPVILRQISHAALVGSKI